MQIARGYSLAKAPTPTFDQTPDRVIHPDRTTPEAHPDRVQRKEHAAGRVANTPNIQHRACVRDVQRNVPIKG